MVGKSLNTQKYYELTDDECNKLIKLAGEAMKNTYPKSGDGYAVALMTKARNVYTGVSYKSDTQTLTMHSEATALAHAAIHGEKDIVAITGPNCHICKQLIYESSLRSGVDIVVVIKENNQIKQIPISKLMPYPWPEKLPDEKTK
jgi:cytidine deaminase